MGIHYRRAKIHWNYFLSIERDFEKLSRYVEFTKANNETFSIELARLIMSSAQEVDVIMKKLCLLVDSESNTKNIKDYKEVITANLPEFVQEEISIPRFGMSGKPWINWNDDKNPPCWWTANNKIKHQRTDHFEKANLKNAFNAIGGLLITTAYYYKKEIETEQGSDVNWQDVTSLLLPKTSLYRLNDDYYFGEVTGGALEW
jgi:hypothetical protein